MSDLTQNLLQFSYETEQQQSPASFKFCTWEWQIPTISWTTYHKQHGQDLLSRGSQQQTSPVAVGKKVFCKVKETPKNNGLVECHP